ncbi:MAG: hypothetical protein HYR91_05165 [Flavobacteriia bacterium]|nr:hypothetical protein [Flavobacteriia bacterium]
MKTTQRNCLIFIDSQYYMNESKLIVIDFTFNSFSVIESVEEWDKRIKDCEIRKKLLEKGINLKESKIKEESLFNGTPKVFVKIDKK